MKTLIADISIPALILAVAIFAVLSLPTGGRPPDAPVPVQLSFDDSDGEYFVASNVFSTLYVLGTNETFRGYSVVLNTDHIMRVVDEELAGARSNILRRLSDE